jgi:hypothetical protein
MGYGYGCCSTASSQRSRSFLTKEERIELLKEYKNDLEKETQGVAEKIKELEVGWTNAFFNSSSWVIFYWQQALSQGISSI